LEKGQLTFGKREIDIWELYNLGNWELDILGNWELDILGNWELDILGNWQFENLGKLESDSGKQHFTFFENSS
jgi:hypothetical protein